MPASKRGMHSIKNRKMYEGLRRHGFSKERAAKISNWAYGKGIGRRGGRKRR